MSTIARNDADESAPLLSGSAENRDWAAHTPVDEVDQQSLDLNLARVSSIPHGGEIEPGFLVSDELPYREQDDDTESPKSHFINISPSKFWAIFSGVLAAYLLAFFDSTLMGSIHPVVTSHFNAANSASWLSTSFLLTCTAFQPMFGRISDTFGRRPVYLFTISVFFVTTAWCTLAQSITSFIAARAFCGLGAGGVTCLGMIICSDLIQVEYRGLYQSGINFAYGTGACLGLTFGGLLADTLGWRASFGVQLPFILLYLILAYITTPSDLGPCLARNRGWGLREAVKTIDLKGSFLLVTGVTALMLGLNLGGNILSWGHPLVVSSLVAFLIIAAIFIRVESRTGRPVIPLPLLSNAPRANLILSNFFANITIHTIMFNAPLFFQAVRLESPTNAGLRLLPASVGLMVTSVATGFLISWTRKLKPTLIIGSICLVCGSISTGNLNRQLPTWLAVLFIIPSNFGQGFAFPTTVVSALAVSTQEDQAVVTTTLGLFRTLGSVLGVAISSWVLQNALVLYLGRCVTGVDKAEIIQSVRRSITAIHDLDPIHQDQGTSPKSCLRSRTPLTFHVQSSERTRTLFARRSSLVLFQLF
jgi:MFS family permease